MGVSLPTSEACIGVPGVGGNDLDDGLSGLGTIGEFGLKDSAPPGAAQPLEEGKSSIHNPTDPIATDCRFVHDRDHSIRGLPDGRDESSACGTKPLTLLFDGSCGTEG